MRNTRQDVKHTHTHTHTHRQSSKVIRTECVFYLPEEDLAVSQNRVVPTSVKPVKSHIDTKISVYKDISQTFDDAFLQEQGYLNVGLI